MPRVEGNWWVALGFTALLNAAPVQADDLFVDMASALGLNDSGIAYGASWGDANGDGLPDLWLGNRNAAPVLYLNDGSGFSAAPAISGLLENSMYSATWADVDNDGDQDLLIMAGADGGTGSDPNQLLINAGNAQFTEQAATLGLDLPLGRGRQGTFLDWNNDGELDVLLVNRNNRSVAPQQPTQLFTRQPGSGTWLGEPGVFHSLDTTWYAQLGFNNAAVPGQPVLWVQHDQTFFPDSVSSYGAGGLSDVSGLMALPRIDRVVDSALVDLDNDLSVDLVTVSRPQIRALLQIANGMDPVSSADFAGVRHARFVTAADFDNDKDVDLYVARSHINRAENLNNLLFLNNGDGTFVEAPGASGAAGTSMGFVGGLASADINNDGFIDLLTANGEDVAINPVSGPLQLFVNQGNANNWLMVELVGTQSNRDAIGASVIVTSGGTSQLREQNGGVHHRSQDHRRLHFGLGSDALIDQIEVRWPSGIVQVLSNIDVNQRLRITEGDPAAPNQSPSAFFAAMQSAGTTDFQFDAAGSSDPGRRRSGVRVGLRRRQHRHRA